MKHNIGAESYLEGAVAIAQRGSEDMSCVDCGTIYDLLLAYRGASEPQETYPEMERKPGKRRKAMGG